MYQCILLENVDWKTLFRSGLTSSGPAGEISIASTVFPAMDAAMPNLATTNLRMTTSKFSFIIKEMAASCMNLQINTFDWKCQEQAEACIEIAHSLVFIKKDVFILLPTGMGKTLVIGVAAKILVSQGKCLVLIVPTNAVMDQVLRVLEGFKIPTIDLSIGYTTLDGN
jgi:hypothetical protein